VDIAEKTAIGRETISEILGQFPNLRSTEDQDVPVEISITLPVQKGLQQEVWLALQNTDELTFCVNYFQCEWFPCTDRSQVERFVYAVTGWLSGRHRILEHYRGPRCVKAELQAGEEGDWKTFASWGQLSIPYPFRRTTRVLTNDDSPQSNVR
jgi:hypothetical protein